MPEGVESLKMGMVYNFACGKLSEVIEDVNGAISVNFL